MNRRGRKPLGAEHVQRLDGSELARVRLQMILETLGGALTIPQACQQLRIGEARFHAMRRDWLQGALELLEPRQLGRPRKNKPAAAEETAAEAENVRLRQELQLATAKQEVAQIMALPGPAKKKSAQPVARRPR